MMLCDVQEGLQKEHLKAELPTIGLAGLDQSETLPTEAERPGLGRATKSAWLGKGQGFRTQEAHPAKYETAGFVQPGCEARTCNEASVGSLTVGGSLSPSLAIIALRHMSYSETHPGKRQSEWRQSCKYLEMHFCIGYALDMHWICIGYALDMHWICIGYALDMHWICNGYALVQDAFVQQTKKYQELVAKQLTRVILLADLEAKVLGCPGVSANIKDNYCKT